MSKTLPPKVQAAKDEPHHVFDWTVPAALEGKPLTISGTLDYEPPELGRSQAAVRPARLVGGGAAAAWLRLRRMKRDEAPATD